MSSYKRPPKPLSVLEKKVPKSDKFSHVQSKLDTGLTVDKVKFVSNKEYTRRRDEIHFRLNKSQMYGLFCEYEADEHEDIAENSINNGAPRIVSYNELSTPQYAKPYLIYDVREQSEFTACHLVQARSYPYTMMRRDSTHPELMNFKNKEGSLIILYCDDERISMDAAKLLVQRGCDNIYLLTGGLFEFAAEYPNCVEGHIAIPAHITTSRAGTSGLSGLHIAEGKSGSGSVTGSRIGTGMSTKSSNLIGRKLGLPSTSRSRRDDASDSGMSTVSVADSIISKATARKGKF